MRMSRDATAQSKARIVAAAAAMVRERGVEATGVADVMQAAGMTNGGFYRHFRSKDEMIAAAIRAAFEGVVERFDRRLRREGAAAAVRAYVDEYLSARHVGHAGLGCPVAALGAEAGRRPDAFAAEFVAGAESLIARLAADGPGRIGPRRAAAIRRLTMLVGAVVTARAVGPGALQDEIVAACRLDADVAERSAGG